MQAEFKIHLKCLTYLKSNILIEDYILVSFDIKNIFSSIDNQSGLRAVKNAVETSQEQFPPTNSITESLKLCLESNCYIFNNKHFLQIDGTVRFRFMSCSNSDIVTENLKQKHYTIIAQLQPEKDSKMKGF